MPAEIRAKMVDGKGKVGFIFDPGYGAEVVAVSVGKAMEAFVGPFKIDMVKGWARMVFATCSARMVTYQNNGAFVVMIEFETLPPAASQMGMMLAGSVSKKSGN